MIFVKANNLTSGYLRADQIADKLNAKVYLNELPNVSRETVIFVKDAKPELVYQAKEAYCKIVYDPIDTFAYPDRQKWHDWFGLVDTVIAYNQAQATIYEKWFRSSVIIPHQWDVRLDGLDCSHDVFRPAYIGYSFNCPLLVQNSGIDIVSNPEFMLQAMPDFNCHVSIRESIHGKMKPATKVSCAAAVGAVIITTPDASVRELLPNDYPYWCNGVSDFSNMLYKAKEEFNTSTWDKARSMMAEVKKKTSLDTIAGLYLSNFSNY